MLKLLGIFILALYFLTLPKPTNAAIEFSLANPQSDGETVTMEVSISGLASTSCLNNTCYLQAAFTSQNQQRYFGFTKANNGDWYQYDGSPGKDNIKSNLFSFIPQDGNWSGPLTIKVDTSDSDYKGPGTYDIKAWRYSGNSDSSSGDSDNLLAVELTTQLSPEPEPTSSGIASPSSSSSTSSTKSPTPTPKNSSASTTKNHLLHRQKL